MSGFGHGPFGHGPFGQGGTFSPLDISNRQVVYTPDITYGAVSGPLTPIATTGPILRSATLVISYARKGSP